ncbi:hypothetical protein ABZS76_32770 [Streptomyces sp. NPDC005562]|uniref:hypothetical protein n=1 Tax=Streptomyces sp. NPDC005562 TaxID=3154890 RepID=UPI0033B66906
MWTVYLGTDLRGLDDHGALRLEEAVGTMPGIERVRVDNRPTLAFTLAVDEDTPSDALKEALRVCEMKMNHAVGGVLEVVRTECIHGGDPDWLPGRLITHRGLAERFQISETWVRQLMQQKGCPVDPVTVEGGDRAAIYPTEPAVAYLAERVRKTA